MIQDGWSGVGRDNFSHLLGFIGSPVVPSVCGECARPNVAKALPRERNGRLILRWRSPDGVLREEFISEPVARLVRLIGLVDAAWLVGRSGGKTINLPERATAEDYGASVPHMTQGNAQLLIAAFGPGALPIPEDRPFVARVFWSSGYVTNKALAHAFKVAVSQINDWILEDSEVLKREREASLRLPLSQEPAS